MRAGSTNARQHQGSCALSSHPRLHSPASQFPSESSVPGAPAREPHLGSFVISLRAQESGVQEPRWSRAHGWSPGQAARLLPASPCPASASSRCHARPCSKQRRLGSPPGMTGQEKEKCSADTRGLPQPGLDAESQQSSTLWDGEHLACVSARPPTPLGLFSCAPEDTAGGTNVRVCRRGVLGQH